MVEKLLRFLYFLLKFLSDVGTSSLIAQKLFSASLIISPSRLIFWTSIPALLLVDLPLIVFLQFAPCLLSPTHNPNNNNNNSLSNLAAASTLSSFASKFPLRNPKEWWPAIRDLFSSSINNNHHHSWIPLSQQDDSSPGLSSTATFVASTPDLASSSSANKNNHSHQNHNNNNNHNQQSSTSSRNVAIFDANQEEQEEGDVSYNHHQTTTTTTTTINNNNTNDPELGLGIRRTSSSSSLLSNNQTDQDTFDEITAAKANYYNSKSSSVLNRIVSQFCTLKFCAKLCLLFCLIFINGLLFMLCLVTIAPYEVHEILWSWDEALENMSNFSELAFLASRSEYIPTFIKVSFILLACGSLVTLTRLGISYLNPSKRAIGITCLIYLIIAIFVRPPHSVVATNILLDGLFAFANFYKRKMFNKTDTINSGTGYMIDNHNSTKLFDLGQGDGTIGNRGYDHIIVVFLESADKLAWPFTRKFCQERNCMDLDSNLNATHFTPFFYNFTRASLDVPLFKTNVPFTIKSHWATLCGQMHMAKDMATEFRYPWALPCLPHLVKLFDQNFTSAFIEPSTTEWDNQNIMLEKEGFDFIWNKERMDEEYGGERPMTNYWGYADHQAHPKMFEWIDDQIENNKRMLLVHSTTTMHDPFSLPPGYNATHYTKTGRVNGYLNVIKYTDHYLKVLIDGLEERGILDKTLLVIQGDHGPRINWHGDNQDDDSAISHPTPLIFSTQQTRQRYYQNHEPALASEVKWTSIDVLPTILDTMGVNSTIWSQYMGQSILRKRNMVPNRTFHTVAPGGRGAQIHEGHRKVLRKWNGDLCGFDLDRDPREWYGWCLNSPYTNDRGWMEAMNEETGTMRSGEQDWPNEDERNEFQDWVRDASKTLLQQIAMNEAWWEGGKSVENQHEEIRQNFEQTVQESKDQGTLWL